MEDKNKKKKGVFDFLGAALSPSEELTEKLLALGKVLDEQAKGGVTVGPPPENKFALFYGFNGLLAKKYSIIVNMTAEEIRARMMMLKLKTKVVWTIHPWAEFEKIIAAFAGTDNEVEEIGFEDAMSILRVGQLNEFEKFIEAETDEFTETCIPGECKPGSHKCGKINS